MSKRIIVPIDLAHADRATAMIDAAHNLGGADANVTLVNVIEDVPTYIAAELPGGASCLYCHHSIRQKIVFDCAEFKGEMSISEKTPTEDRARHLTDMFTSFTLVG